MRFRGFSVEDGHQLVVDGARLDLRDVYDFVRCAHEPCSETASLQFRRFTGSPAGKSSPREIRLLFRDVSRFEVCSADPATAGEDAPVRFLGLAHPDDPTVAGHLDEQGDPTQDFVVELENGFAVRIHAEDVRAALVAPNTGRRRLRAILSRVFVVSCSSGFVLFLVVVWGWEPGSFVLRLLGSLLVITVATALAVDVMKSVEDPEEDWFEGWDEEDDEVEAREH